MVCGAGQGFNNPLLSQPDPLTPPVRGCSQITSSELGVGGGKPKDDIR